MLFSHMTIGAIAMSAESPAPPETLRLLECWLPLAQQLNQDLGWGRTAAELEALIIATAPDLAQTDSATTARAVLWRQHLRERSAQP
jgi:hypothetical protein